MGGIVVLIALMVVVGILRGRFFIGAMTRTADRGRLGR